MSEEWGPWIEHDGKGCPVPSGTWCHRIFDRAACGDDVTLHGSTEDFSPVDPIWERPSWEWDSGCVRIVRYRIRKPRALQQLRDIAEGVKQPEEAL